MLIQINYFYTRMKPASQGPRKDLKYISQHSPEINNDSCGPVVEIYFERVFLKHFSPGIFWRQHDAVNWDFTWISWFNSWKVLNSKLRQCENGWMMEEREVRLRLFMINHKIFVKSLIFLSQCIFMLLLEFFTYI